MNYSNSSNLTMYTRSQQYLDDVAYVRAILINLGIVCIAFSVLIIVANCLTITVILSSAALRTQLRNQIILNICFVDLLEGLIYAPFYGKYLLNHDSAPSCEYGIFIYFTFSHADMFLVMWFLVTQDFIYLTKQLRLDLPLLSNRSQILVKTFWNGLPWMMVFVVLFPMVFAGFDKSRTYSCLTHAYNANKIHSIALSFFVPATIVLVLVVCFVVFHTCAKRQVRVGERSLLDGPSGLEHPICYIVPSLTVVLFSFWEQLASLYQHVTPPSYYLYHVRLMFDIVVTGTAVGLARCAILPLTWLILPDVRAAMVDLWKTIRGSTCRSRWTEQHTVSYKKDEESP